MSSYDLNELKPLTTDQFDRCKAAALERVKSRIGTRPTRKQYRREYAPLLGIVEYLCIVVFGAAFFISSVHILSYAGTEAHASYTATTADVLGLKIGGEAYGIIHQIGFILLAESSMLLFFVQYQTRPTADRYLSLVLALMAMAFVIVANLSSGLNAFLSILAPAFTVGIGFRLEAVIAEKLRRDSEIDAKYRAALEVWEASQEDQTKHPEYRALLAQELWQKLVSLKANAGYAEASGAFKHAAVRRELMRDAWAYEAAQDMPLTAATAPIVETQEAVATQDFLALTPAAMTTYSAANGRPNGAGGNGAHSG